MGELISCEDENRPWGSTKCD